MKVGSVKSTSATARGEAPEFDAEYLLYAVRPRAFCSEEGIPVRLHGVIYYKQYEYCSVVHRLKTKPKPIWNSKFEFRFARPSPSPFSISLILVALLLVCARDATMHAHQWSSMPCRFPHPLSANVRHARIELFLRIIRVLCIIVAFVPVPEMRLSFLGFRYCNIINLVSLPTNIQLPTQFQIALIMWK